MSVNHPTPRNISKILLVGALGLAGCASTVESAKAPDAPERTRIAPGVELVVSDRAGSEARRIADEIQRKYASELLSARPSDTAAWPAR